MQRTGDGSRAGRFFWPIGNAKSGRRIPGAERQRGNIVERISDDLYVFKDASGTINVDIDHKRWNGVTVTPKDTVEIQGEVDKDWNSVEIDVKQIRKVNP